jgi:hypothetical protein
MEAAGQRGTDLLPQVPQLPQWLGAGEARVGSGAKEAAEPTDVGAFAWLFLVEGGGYSAVGGPDFLWEVGELG